MSKRRPQNIIKCACGCGTEFPEVGSSGKKRRYVHGHNNRGVKFPNKKLGHTDYQREILRKNFTGKNNPKWKGGHQSHGSGYMYLLKPEHPNADSRGRILEHRLIMEQHLGRYLDPEEVVHHINKIAEDNRIENLQLFSSNGEHLKFELTGRSSPLKGQKIHSDGWKREQRQRWTGENNPRWLGEKASERAKRRRK